MTAKFEMLTRSQAEEARRTPPSAKSNGILSINFFDGLGCTMFTCGHVGLKIQYKRNLSLSDCICGRLKHTTKSVRHWTFSFRSGWFASHIAEQKSITALFYGCKSQKKLKEAELHKIKVMCQESFSCTLQQHHFSPSIVDNTTTINCFQF